MYVYMADQPFSVRLDTEVKDKLLNELSELANCSIEYRRELEQTIQQCDQLTAQYQRELDALQQQVNVDDCSVILPIQLLKRPFLLWPKLTLL